MRQPVQVRHRVLRQRALGGFVAICSLLLGVTGAGQAQLRIPVPTTPVPAPTVRSAEPQQVAGSSRPAESTQLEKSSRLAVPRRLIIESIELVGNTRTAAPVAIAVAGIEAGDQADPDQILAATERLRQSGLFRAVKLQTRPGSSPGQVRVIFEVEENRPQVRFGLGYEDLSGWYLIPVQLNLDNLSGHGEAFDLSTRIGYRLAGIALSYRRPLVPSPDFWEIRLRAESQDRIYFFDETEFSHPVDRGGLDLRFGRRLSDALALEMELAFESVVADSSAEVYRTREARGRQEGEALEFEDLPASIQDDLAPRSQTRLGVATVLDRRQGTGLLTRGVWGRLGGQGVLSEEGNFARGALDLRAYAPLGRGILLAARSRAGVVSSSSPFFERYYLGGLYTVRGYPSQALSPAGGDLRFATASLELRTAWIGPPRDPRLVGLLFADAGLAWSCGKPSVDDGAAGIGYGFRLRLPWIGQLGLDVGHPLSSSPIDEAFHLNLVLGWTY